MKAKGKPSELTGTKKGKVRVIGSTRRGDRGQTSLLSGERVSKADFRIEACGNVDESNAALGVAKAFAQNEKIREIIAAIQKDLLLVGAELATTNPDHQSKRIEEDQILRLENWIKELQGEVPLSRRFVDPGANPTSAALDLARSVVRRTERSVVVLQELGELQRGEVLSYLNRLACLVFTLARYAEKLA